MTCFAFDLDETLARTRDLVIRAYEEVGVTNARENFGRAAREWLGSGTEAIQLHADKTAAYMHLLSNTPVHLLATGATQFARHLIDNDCYVAIVTSASSVSTHAVLRALRLPYGSFDVHTGVKREDKPKTVRLLSKHGRYIDDDLGTCDAIGELAGWRSFHFFGHTFDELQSAHMEAPWIR